MNEQIHPPEISTGDSSRPNHTLDTSAETWGPTQFHTVTGTFQRPGARAEANTYEGRLTIPGHREPTETDDIRTDIATNRTIVVLIHKDTMSSAMSSEIGEGAESESASVESFPRPHCSTFSPASAPAVAGALTPSGPNSDEDGPLGLYHPLDYLIAKHPKVVSRVSNVLIAVGGIVLLPGVSAWINGTIFAHPAVTVAGAMAVVVGKWLRSALKSAAAKRAAQTRLRGQGIINDVNGRRGRTERDCLLSVEFLV